MVASVQVQHYPEGVLAERAGYFPVSGSHLYTVLHEVRDPIARVLLVGTFASERHSSYLPWVRWARFLASRKIEVLRYDYRGVGESTGMFEHMTLTAWMEDIQLLSAWLNSRSPDVPLVLHGLELGALLAARTFHEGEGEALMMWCPPATANDVLRSALLRWLGPQLLLKSVEERKSASHYFKLLESGENVVVDGYEWSSELWRQSFSFALPAAMVPPNDASGAYRRPVRSVSLGKEATPLVRGGVAGFEEAKDFDWLFVPEFQWIASSVNVTAGAS